MSDRPRAIPLALDTGPIPTDAFARSLGDPEVALALSRAIADCPFDAVFWETAPTTAATRRRPLEMVLVDAPRLARVHPDPVTFAHELVRFDGPGTFWNLGGDALLVVPQVGRDVAAGTHLAAYCRGASDPERIALWAAVGRAWCAWWDDRPDPVWVSTSGLGVSWVHIRLDRRPKYYTWAPFRAAPAPA